MPFGIATRSSLLMIVSFAVIVFLVKILSHFSPVFDNGGLKDDPIQAQQLVNSLLNGMQDDRTVSDDSEEHPLVQVHNSVWRRLAKVSTGYFLAFFCLPGEIC